MQWKNTKLYKAGGEKRMKIKFDRYENDKLHSKKTGKDYSIYRIHGTALSGKLKGQDWNTQIFVTAKDMVSQVKGFNKGDIVDVTMKEKNGYWNPTGFAKDDNYTESVTVGSSGSASPMPVVSSRLENLKVAISILGMKPTKKNAADYLIEAGGVADMVQDYIDEKGAFQFSDAGEGIPEAEEVAPETPDEV